MEEDVLRLVRLAIAEDFDRGIDVTSHILVAPQATGALAVVSRSSGVICGLRAIDTILGEFHVELRWEAEVADGSVVEAGTLIGRLTGDLRDLLAVERTLLNFLAHLSGIASLTHSFVRSVAGTDAAICDTRKTPAGWRHLSKYAVRCGGGVNHRTGLYDAVLIKDNHLAAWAAAAGTDAGDPQSVARAIRHAREEVAAGHGLPADRLVVQVELDDLRPLDAVLEAGPDLILLDNFSLHDLRRAVVQRDAKAPRVGLEASGGVTLETVRAIAETGVDRISVGALTHSAPALDLGADWSSPSTGSNRT